MVFVATVDGGKVQLGDSLCPHPRQVQSKPFLAVQPRLFQVESRDAQQALNHFERVFMAVLSMNALACPELNSEAGHSQSDFLRSQALEKNFHSRTCWSPFRNVTE